MNSKEIKWFNDRHVSKLKGKIFDYNQDKAKEFRKEHCICKYCYYINTGRIAGQAFTTIECKECKKETTFPSTDTDKYCLKCAQKLNVCKHCGSEMD